MPNPLPEITYRPPAGHWLLVLILIGVGGLAACTPLTEPRLQTQSQWLTSGCVAGGFFIAAMVLAWWQVRARIVADQEGLRWRGLGGWRAARWNDVTDFYDRLLPEGKKVARVETAAGTLSLPAQVPELRACIVQYAMRARSRGWGILGTRSEDAWPRTFHYNTRDNRTAPWQVAATALIPLGMSIFAVSCVGGVAAV
ncbi:MAG TPA: hypothetical protein VK689_05645, partial [Armatimonadota bacterium]|nr:hypothetical protein [Armatimonadota bacterium]